MVDVIVPFAVVVEPAKEPEPEIKEELPLIDDVVAVVPAEVAIKEPKEEVVEVSEEEIEQVDEFVGAGKPKKEVRRMLFKALCPLPDTHLCFV